MVIIFTMKGCPYCEMIKEQLKNQEIDFVDRDINEYSDEYDLFVEVTDNEYVPSIMIIEDYDKTPTSYLYAPERDFDEIEEGVEIIKKHVL